MLRYNLGVGYWQVMFVRGKHVKKFSCSRNYYCVLRSKDGMTAYVWANRVVFHKPYRSVSNNSIRLVFEHENQYADKYSKMMNELAIKLILKSYLILF